MQINRAFWLAAGRTSYHAATFWFAPVGGITGALLARLLGVQVTFAPFFPENSLLRTAFDAGVLIILAYILLFSGWFLWFLARRWVIANLNPYLIICAIGVIVALAGLGGYFLVSPRGPIEWDFQRTGYAIRLEWQMQRPGMPLKFLVPGFIFSGQNGPDPLYQIQSSVTIDKDQRVIPLFIAANSQWVQFSNILNIPAGNRFELGCQMRSDTLHCEGFPERLTIDQFFADLGGFTFSFGHDGDPPQKWHFSSATLRKQFEKQMSEAEEAVRNNPQLQPPIPRRDTPN
jgi:hypothetical protein